jgi:hypothetical protein
MESVKRLSPMVKEKWKMINIYIKEIFIQVKCMGREKFVSRITHLDLWESF